MMINALYIEDHSYLAQLILLDMSKFDITLNMNWRIQYDTHINCHKREMVIGQDTNRSAIFKAQKLR